MIIINDEKENILLIDIRTRFVEKILQNRKTFYTIKFNKSQIKTNRKI